MKNTAYFFVILISIVIILIYAKSILVPLILGALLWFIFKEVKALLDNIGFIRRRLPSWIKSLMAALLIFAVLGMGGQMLSSNITNLAQSFDNYESNMELIINQVNKLFNIDIINFAKEQMKGLDFGNILGSIFSSLSDIFSNTFMIVLFSLFILSEENNFSNKIKLLFSDEERYEQATNILQKINQSISSYLGLKSLVSLVTGVLSYFALLVIGIDSPLFWAFLIFLLNFIPTIGSLIGTVFPAIFCLLQFGEFTPSIFVLVLVGAIQLLVGNLLEPRLLGNSMNISPLVTIISLSLWGLIWGITGMILSVPMTVIIIIICSQFEASKPIAILLSEKGNID